MTIGVTSALIRPAPSGQIRRFHSRYSSSIPGLFYDRTVVINIVDSTGVRPVPFSTDLFDYGRNDFKDKIPANLGFAGFRIHHPINTPDYHDEVAVFVGASYLRAVAKNMSYGMSARGLAIDTALNTGEEFPDFQKVLDRETHARRKKNHGIRLAG